MKNSLNADKSSSLGMLLARVPMGAFFLLAGVEKLRHGAERFVHEQISNIPTQVPHDWGMAYLHALPFLEITVGTLLILGLITRLAGLAGALMVISFIVGATGIRSASVPFQPNVIYLGVLLAVVLIGTGRFSVDAAIFGKRKPAKLS